MRYIHNVFSASWLAAVATTVLGMSLACPAHAVPVLIETEGLPAIDVAQRDSAGSLRLFAAEDDNADGIISFVADLDPLQTAWVHINGGSNASHYLALGDSIPFMTGPIPFFITPTEERVITHFNSLPTIPFTLGQPFSVAGGQIPGLDAVVYRSLGFGSAADIVDLDLTTLPLYTGPLEVGGLLRYQIIPEPSMFALGTSGILGLMALALRRRFSLRS